MIIRHDIDPVLYIAKPAEFPAVVAVDSFQEEVQIAHDKIDELLKPSLLSAVRSDPEFRTCYDGMGMLIHPHWILTAAHVATELSVDKTIELADKIYAVEKIVLHPNFRNFGEGQEITENDIALIQLSPGVEDVTPLPLYKGDDELGQMVTFVGRGDFGTGLTGPDQVDGKLRMATNRIEKVDDQWLQFKFDAPPDCSELEGISGPGDSGGPALIKTEEGWVIAGISSSQADSPLGHGYYGVWEYYTRVSVQLDWIESVMQSL